MNMLELHLIQSFPFTCLNRDDVGAPKTAIFGGVQRARVSSQSWKRAIREFAFELAPDYFAGRRGHYHAEALASALIAKGLGEKQAKDLAVAAIDALVKLDAKGKGEGKSSVAVYLSPSEIDAVAETLKDADGTKADAKLIAKAIKSVKPRDAFDISIFGRMVASDHSLSLEAAGMFSHALSTHAVANETDFFSAVDDTKLSAEDAGAGHIGVLEANSACYYRYIGLNLDLFNDADHLKSVDLVDRKAALDVFLRSAIQAIPGARKNSMFGYTLPQYALALVRNGQPLSLINAFEKPIKAGREGGYVDLSVKALKDHRAKLNETYCLKCKGEFELNNIDAWIESIVAAALED